MNPGPHPPDPHRSDAPPPGLNPPDAHRPDAPQHDPPQHDPPWPAPPPLATPAADPGADPGPGRADAATVLMPGGHAPTLRLHRAEVGGDARVAAPTHGFSGLTAPTHPVPAADAARAALDLDITDGTAGPTAAAQELITASQSAVALPPGTVLQGKFTVRQVLGKPGGFGIAYLCHDTRLDRPVVIKELFPYGLVQRQRGHTQVQVRGGSARADFVRQLGALLTEARQLAALDEVPAVVKVYDHFSENDTAYIVMRCVQGRTLGERLKDFTQPLSPAQLMRWIWPLLDGLKAVHAAQVLHRDIKPDNLLIDAQDRPVLIDFGNAAALREAPAGEDEDAYFALSPYYAAPEQYSNDVPRMGPWTDLYAVGAVMYLALTGQRPTDAVKRLMGQPLPPLQSCRPDLPADLVAAVTQCLALDAAQRPSDVAALQQLLAAHEPQARRWTEALPDDAYGRRMRSLARAVAAGARWPRQWNTAAALGQSAWLLLHGQPVVGAALALWQLAVVAALPALLWPGDPWQRLPLGLALAWLPTLLPCGLWGDALRLRPAQALGTQAPLASDTAFAQLQQALRQLGRPRWALLPVALLLPLAWLGVSAALDVRLQQTRHTLAQAVALDGYRQVFADTVRSQGRPPSAEELPPFTPNRELARLELRPSGFELELAWAPVAGRRVRWTLDAAGRWRCEPVDLPGYLAPVNCPAP